MCYPNHAFIEVDDGRITIGNAYILREFSLSQDMEFRTRRICNRRTAKPLDLVFQPCSEEFVLRVLVKRKKTAVLKSSMLKVADILSDDGDGRKTLCIHFAPFRALDVAYLVSERIEVRDDTPFLYKTLQISASDPDVVIDSIDTEHISLPRDLRQKWSRPLEKGAHLTAFQTMLGQPVYLNGMYTGSEFPANDNNIEDGIAHVRYYAGKTLSELSGGKGTYTTWKTVFGAARSTDMEDVRADFLSYIRSISQPLYLRTQYNSWFDHMLDIDEKNINDSFLKIEKGLTQNGVPPLHAYVVDDGWNNYDRDFWGFNDKFPNGFSESTVLTRRLSSNFGMWLGPRGGYNAKTRPFAKRMERANKGGYNRRGFDVCTADHRYQKNLAALFADYMDRFDIDYWKLDGFMVKSCPSQRHGHPTGGHADMYCFTDHWENWIKILRGMRAHRAEAGKALWLNLTCYCNLSPWFLQFCESMWIQNSDDVGFIDETSDGENMHGDDADRMLTYRDARYFDFCRKYQYQFPLSGLYNHEPIYGNSAKVQMTDDAFRKYMYMLATRGTAFWELYYSFALFDDAKWRICADVLRFVAENFHILRNARLIGGSPEAGAVYGYAAWEGHEGIVSVRNPLNRPQSFSFTLDRRIGVSAGEEPFYCAVLLPYTAASDPKSYSFGDTISLDLQPHEVRIFKFGAPEVKAPRLVRAKMTDARTALLTFDKHISVKENSFTENGIPLPAELLENYSEVCVTLPNPLADGAQTEITTDVCDLYGNALQSAAALTYYPDGRLLGVYTGDSDFTLRLRLDHAPKDGVLLTQGTDFVVSVSGGRLIADCKGLKARAEIPVREKGKVRVDVVRERSGLLKIYVDGTLAGSAYDPNRVCKRLDAETLQTHSAVLACVYYDKALAFDEL